MNKQKILEQLKNKLIVSCQAENDEPLGRPEILAAIAETAVMGGAAGIRACYPENISAIKKAVDVPVIGIYKKEYPDSQVFISPTIKENLEIAKTNPEIIALDATDRKRPHNEKLTDIIKELRANFDGLLMADIDTLDNGLKAAELGFDLIGTTLSGYTQATRSRAIDYQPDFKLIQNLIDELKENVPVIAEGRIWNPEDALKIMDIGVHSIVIGSAITRPHHITRRFIKAMN